MRSLWYGWPRFGCVWLQPFNLFHGLYHPSGALALSPKTAI